jgi:hypothetical protein
MTLTVAAAVRWCHHLSVYVYLYIHACTLPNLVQTVDQFMHFVFP